MNTRVSTIGTGIVVLRTTATIAYIASTAGVSYVHANTDIVLNYDSKNKRFQDEILVSDLPVVSAGKYFTDSVTPSDTIIVTATFDRNFYDNARVIDTTSYRSEINGSPVNSHSLGGDMPQITTVSITTHKQEAQDASELDSATASDVVSVVFTAGLTYNGNPLNFAAMN